MKKTKKKVFCSIPEPIGLTRVVALFFLCICIPGMAMSQKGLGDSTDLYRKNLNLAEIDLLYSYYEQDGDHSVVLGGEGTEYLTDQVGQISVMVPIKNHQLTLLLGIDHYTSASTDDINPATVSSASVVDDRQYFNLGWSREGKRWTTGLNSGFSTEWDVQSVTFGGNIGWSDKYKNHQVSLATQIYRDRWSLLYPVELRNSPDYPTGSDIRNIYDVSLNYAFTINRRAQAAIVAQVVHQNGILATPFHRVYFEDQFLPDIERLPRERWKYPVSLRFNYYINERFLLRSYYRYYQDDFDINGHTLQLEVPVKLSPSWAVIPFGRWHTQTAAKYFAPIDVHQSTETYYTSDYDLSEFSSMQGGFSLRYSPVGGIWNAKTPVWKVKGFGLKKIESRIAYYDRSDGLYAWIASIGFKFNLY